MVQVHFQFSLSKLTCLLGFLPLAELPIIKLLGGTQFRKFCIIVIVVLVATVWITCAYHEEEERPKGRRSQQQQEYLLSFISRTVFAELRARNFKDVINNIYITAINLPKPIRRVCYVQLCAFMAWSVIHVLCFQNQYPYGFFSSIGFPFCSTRQCPQHVFFASIDYTT